ncbi:MAG: SagB/ThcOx family dehydrogenase [Candidatus Omnitrophica bacterium]|nr:SagB/ThcOx family dehydrogenase [Candidatus Omnitrophota bacterium]
MAECKRIILPKPDTIGKISLEEVIFKRRSQREFIEKDITIEQLSQILWAGQGVTLKHWGYEFRTAPSAGALYPIELYVVSKDGLFHYLCQEHTLEVISDKDLRYKLYESALSQDSIIQAPLSIVICAVYERVTSKYGQRGIRYVHIEVGHVAQNIHLEVVALGLGSVPIGAFDDEKVIKLLNLPKDCKPLYIIPVGWPK